MSICENDANYQRNKKEKTNKIKMPWYGMNLYNNILGDQIKSQPCLFSLFFSRYISSIENKWDALDALSSSVLVVLYFFLLCFSSISPSFRPFVRLWKNKLSSQFTITWYTKALDPNEMGHLITWSVISKETTEKNQVIVFVFVYGEIVWPYFKGRRMKQKQIFFKETNRNLSGQNNQYIHKIIDIKIRNRMREKKRK